MINKICFLTKTFKIFLIFLLFVRIAGAADVRLQGLILEKGKRKPISGAAMYLMPQKIRYESDPKGNFDISVSEESLRNGDVVFVIQADNYQRLEKFIGPTSDLQNLKIYLEKEVDADFEVTVVDSSLQRDPQKKSLTRQQVFETPGANGDPVKAIENLPGVSRNSGFSSQVAIQGSAPKDTAYDIDGHQIPLVFHFGGLNSVVMPEAVEKVDYYSAGYQVDNSRALGGIISLQTRSPEVSERDHKGLFYADNFSMGGLYEKKIDDSSSILFSGRYSYIGFFIRSAMKDNSSLNLTVAPEFSDITSIYKKKLNDQQDLKVVLVGSKDKLAFVLNEPVKEDPSIRGSFNNEVNFFRLIPQWSYRKSAAEKISASTAVGRDEFNVSIGDKFFVLRSNVLSVRGLYENEIDSKNKYSLGIDNQYSQTSVKLRLPVTRSEGGVSNPVSSSEVREADVRARINNIGSLVRYDYKISEDLILSPGLRYDYFNQTKEHFLNPRFSSVLSQSKSETVKFSAGQFVQPPEPQESSREFGNPDIKSPQAFHLALGYEKDFREGQITGQTASVGLFYKKLNRVVVQSSNSVQRDGSTVYEIYNNDGQGRAYGVELQHKISNEIWQLITSYTWSKSTRSDSNHSNYNFEYDQTHNLNLIAMLDLKNSWKISGRFRYVTGNPQTPVLGSVYDADNETYLPVRGTLNSIRNRDFHQLDLRIDKKWINDESIWTFYIDIQNLLNTKNVEGVQYSYDYSVKKEVTGLPTIPAIGVRGEF